MQYNLGRVAPIFRGQYDPAKEYDTLDIVYNISNNSSWVALIDRLVGIEPNEENDQYWALVCHGSALDPDVIRNILETYGFVIDRDYVHTDNNFTDEYKNKLDNLPDAGVQGVQGIQGIQGVQGITGQDGQPGTQGTQGIQGIQGVQGITGQDGQPGTQGIQGIQGVQGITGQDGQPGIQGTQGIQGGKGVQGITGQDGQPGIQGTQGIQGGKGVQGIQGAKGLDDVVNKHAEIPVGSNEPTEIAKINDTPITATTKLYWAVWE